MDDSARTLPTPTAAIAKERQQTISRILDEKMATAGVSQNRDKQELQAVFYGPNAKNEMKQFYGKGTMRVQGRPRLRLRYLGHMSHPEDRRMHDRAHRLAAGKKGWAAGRHFWTGKAPLKQKKEVFTALVYNSTMSGQESEHLEPGDFTEYDRYTMTKGRAMLGAAAYTKFEKQHSTWQRKSNSECRRMLKMPTTRSYHRYQRISFAQQMLKHPQEYEGLRTALLLSLIHI